VLYVPVQQGDVACMVVVRNACKTMVGKPQGRNYLEGLSIDRRKIFQCVPDNIYHRKFLPGCEFDHFN
jgi:hypothetical protein